MMQIEKKTRLDHKMTDYAQADDGCDTALTCVEIVEALEVLEYHDRNYLSAPMAQAKKCNVEKRALLARAKAILKARQ